MRVSSLPARAAAAAAVVAALAALAGAAIGSLAAVAGAVVGGLLVFGFVQAGIAPLHRVREAIDAVDLSRPERRVAPVTGSSEVRAVAEAHNRMLDRVEGERRRAGAAVLHAQERERAKVAQDLHDEVNQALTGLLLRLEVISQDAPPELSKDLREAKGVAQTAMDELLNLARQLRPTSLDEFGLIHAITAQTQHFQRRTGIETRFRHHGGTPSMSSDQQLVLYRIVQEALSNIAKHAGARHVAVDLSFVGRTVLRVTDDGQGIPAYPGERRRPGRPQGRPGGLGLSGMRERALIAGGQLNVFSEEGKGTTVELTMDGA